MHIKHDTAVKYYISSSRNNERWFLFYTENSVRGMRMREAPQHKRSLSTLSVVLTLAWLSNFVFLLFRTLTPRFLHSTGQRQVLSKSQMHHSVLDWLRLGDRISRLWARVNTNVLSCPTKTPKKTEPVRGFFNQIKSHWCNYGMRVLLVMMSAVMDAWFHYYHKSREIK